MTNELGMMGRLLEACGRMSGQRFRLFPVEGPFVVDGADSLSAPTLQSLAEEAAGTDGPCLRQAEDGRWLGGVVVPVSGKTRLFCAYPCRDHGSPQHHEQDALDVLQCMRRLMEEREASSAESRALIEELNKTYEDLHLFSRIATQIRSLHYSEQMLRDLLQEMREAMRVEVAAALFEPGSTSDVAASSSDLGSLLADPHAFLAELSAEMPRSAPAFERNGFIINNSSELPAFARMHAQPFRALAIDIRNGGRQYGRLVLVSFNMKEVFRRGEYRLLSAMTEQLALVIANTDLYRDLELFVINLVRSFVTAIEAKDPYTKGHSERVSQLSMRIGDAMHINQAERSALQQASVLHDVGKIGTPEAILNKPDRLSDQETDNIKGHPAKGAQILTPIAQLAEALPGIRHHHERYDGKGYPDGLAGDDIPLLARIIAVADTYDAITSTRAYRPGRPHADAMRIILDCAGTQLDPSVVDVFSSMQKQTPKGSAAAAHMEPLVATPAGAGPQQEGNI